MESFQYQSEFFRKSCVTDTLKITKKFQSTALSLYRQDEKRMVFILWKHSNNGIYLSYPVLSRRNTTTGDLELKIETYLLSDQGHMNDAVMQKLGDIIECKRLISGMLSFIITSK